MFHDRGIRELSMYICLIYVYINMYTYIYAHMHFKSCHCFQGFMFFFVPSHSLELGVGHLCFTEYDAKVI